MRSLAIALIAGVGYIVFMFLLSLIYNFPIFQEKIKEIFKKWQ